MPLPPNGERRRGAGVCSHLDGAGAAVIEQREGLLELLELVRAEVPLRAHGEA